MPTPKIRLGRSAPDPLGLYIRADRIDKDLLRPARLFFLPESFLRPSVWRWKNSLSQEEGRHDQRSDAGTQVAVREASLTSFKFLLGTFYTNVLGRSRD